MTFKDEQLNIIDAPLGQNILVSAAAGSGKTTVLTERITRKILGANTDDKEISLSNILIMTFTKKATLEMKERIKKKLDERLTEGKNIKKLIRESSIIQNANISTIDSFCKKILEENYTALNNDNSLYSDFDLTYRIADNQEILVLWDDVIDAFLEKEYANPKYKRLFDSYVEKANDKALRNLLKEGIKFLASVPWPYEYLSMQILDFEKISKKAYDEYVRILINKLKDFRLKVEEKIDFVEEILDLYKKSYDSGLVAKKPLTEAGKVSLTDSINYFTDIVNFLKTFVDFKFLTDEKENYIDKNLFLDSYKEANNLLSKSPVFARVNYVLGINDKDEYATIKNEYNDFIKEFSILNDIYNVLNVSDDRIYNENDKLYLEFLRDCYLSILKEKGKRNIYEIGDYARMALDILYDKNVDKSGHINRTISKNAKTIGDRYELIFVDEYQDTNLIQEKLIAAISDDFKKGNVFMVGDVKQSIYRFRNSEPSIFVNKLNDYKEGKGGTTKSLSTNYRSDKEIIGYVNDLFSKTMTLDYGEIDYTDGNALGLRDDEIKREIDNNKKVEIHIISKEEKNDEDKKDSASDNNDKDNNLKNDNKEETYQAIEYEADYVATEIERLNREEGYKYSDIVILLRVEKNKGKVFQEALKRHKIPSYSEQKTGFFDKLEIKLMIDLLSVVDNPLQDIILASVLMSNVFNVSNDELAFIRIATKGLNLYDGLIAIDGLLQGSEDNKNDLKPNVIKQMIKKYGIDITSFEYKIRNFLNSLQDLQFRARYFSISNLIDYIYNTLHVKEIVSAMTDGKLRSANLDLLYNFAVKFENNSYIGLFNFNRYIKKINSVEVDLGQAKIFDENSDAVRIMTLHTSKGLEFKTVFLCSCNTKYNFKDLDIKNDYQFDKDYGVALDFYDLKKTYKSNTPKKLLLAAKKEDEIKQEELRMLYVALTRAEEKLYITGIATRNTGFSEKDLEKFVKNKNEGKNMNLNIKDCDCYLDVVLSNYPVNDEKYSEVFVAPWSIEDEALDVSETSIDEVISHIRNEENISKECDEYFGSVKKEVIENNLNDNYNYIDYQKIVPKLSVSQIKNSAHKNIESTKFYDRKDDEDRDEAKIDKYNNDIEIIDGREIGNAYHRCMQFLNFENGEVSYINQDESLLDKIISKEKIDNFYKSKLGLEMKSAFKNQKLYREQKFMKLYSQSEVNDYMIDSDNKILDLKIDILNEKNIIIQGIIDAFYIKKDENGAEYIVLIDYKTDAMRNKSLDEDKLKKKLIDNYKLQLNIYADALKELTGLDVKEKYLYSFAIDEAIEVL